MAEHPDVSGLASMIGSITSDPELMSRLRGVADSMKESAADDTPQNGDPAAEAAVILRGKGRSDAKERKQLLEALRPFLSQERRDKADMLINVISLIDSGIVDMIRKGGK